MVVVSKGYVLDCAPFLPLLVPRQVSLHLLEEPFRVPFSDRVELWKNEIVIYENHGSYTLHIKRNYQTVT